MSTRRQFLAVSAAALGLTTVFAWIVGPEATSPAPGKQFPVKKTDNEWRAGLSREQYRVLRRQGTERACSSELDHEKRRGVFKCVGCGHALFSSDTKFDSGTGWPSFWAPLDNAVETSVDTSWLMIRTEVHCAQCGGHLGHLFSDGPKPTGLRYCMNGVAMRFVANA